MTESDGAAGRKVTVDHLFEVLYPELRRLAAARMRREGSGHSWQPTLLVNELYLELLKNKALDRFSGGAPERQQFMGLAAFLMKRLLILHSRPLSQRAKVIGAAALGELPASATAESLQSIDDLLARIERLDPKFRTVVEMKVFEGSTHEEIAARLGCTPRSVGTYWSFARQWLETELGPVA
jgi:RNA polymerase sigma factor (TIGR02999 family)